MVKQTIQIFCRVKPTKSQTGLYDLDEDEDSNRSLLSFTIPKDIADGLINNKKENYKFLFDKIFNQTTKQDEVFNAVAKPVINSVLSGFNGTIFAYGQTGSGKTFTITGGAERYVDRGIIPRTLSYIFEHIAKNNNNVYTIHVSYLEIYNESGFDLLDPNHEASKLEDLPKVSFLEDNDGNIHLKNLSMQQALNEEEALNLLFLGDTNRMIAETPMNQASTRSHCIFTIHISARENDSATIRRAKLHLVDLAGSERVGKTGVAGTLLKEAKYINLSLHFLEQVIIALSEKTRSHIPYRNSMMTSVLRDSLGGNCMTSMIATCSVEKKNIDESISTCRFAQRVAMIKNDAILNEELDPQLMIAKLKREVQQLKDELSLATGEQYETELTQDEKERLGVLVEAYVKNTDKEAVLNVGSDMRKINHAFYLLKRYAINNNTNEQPQTEGRSSRQFSQRSQPQGSPSQHVITTPAQHHPTDNTYLGDTQELQKLKDLILQRDNEINILVNMLKKEKQRNGKTSSSSSFVNQTLRQSSERKIDSSNINSRSSSGKSSAPEEESSRMIGRQHQRNANHILRENVKKQKDQMSLGRQEAFELFKRDYAENGLIEENKKGLKSRYTDAKRFGEQVNAARSQINVLKTKLEKLKMRRSLQAASGKKNMSEEDEEENEIRQNLDQQKQKYKQSFNQLKALKTEIEHMQYLLEKSKVKLQNDFETWWNEQTISQDEIIQNPLDIGVRKAWRTPPPLTPLESTPFAPNDETRKGERHSLRKSEKSGSSSLSNNEQYRQSHSSINNDNCNPNYNGSKERLAPGYDTKYDSNPSSNIKEHSRNSILSSQQNSKNNSRNSVLSSIQQKHSITAASSTNQMQSRDSSVSGNGERPKSSGLRLTGDPDTDDDIMAFMKARQEILKRSQR